MNGLVAAYAVGAFAFLFSFTSAVVLFRMADKLLDAQDPASDVSHPGDRLLDAPPSQAVNVDRPGQAHAAA